MPDAISNTSPLVYLYRIHALDWLGSLFGGAFWTWPGRMTCECTTPA